MAFSKIDPVASLGVKKVGVLLRFRRRNVTLPVIQLSVQNVKKNATQFRWAQMHPIPQATICCMGTGLSAGELNGVATWPNAKYFIFSEYIFICSVLSILNKKSLIKTYQTVIDSTGKPNITRPKGSVHVLRLTVGFFFGMVGVV